MHPSQCLFNMANLLYHNKIFKRFLRATFETPRTSLGYIIITPYGWFSLDSQAPPKRTTSWMQYFIHIVIYVNMTYILSSSSMFDYRFLTLNLSHILPPFSGAKVENSHIWSRWVVIFYLVQTSIHCSKSPMVS
jgi:hypothetical protein